MNFFGTISAIIFLTLLIGGTIGAAKESTKEEKVAEPLTVADVYVIMFIALLIWGLGYLSNIN